MLILHVDDDENIRVLTELAFALAGAGTIRSAGSGAEAIAVLAGGLRPELIILDVMMPEMDGPRVLEQIRLMPDLEETPIVFMTAQSQGHEMRRLVELGAVGVIIKPFDPLTLPREINALLAETRP